MAKYDFTNNGYKKLLIDRNPTLRLIRTGEQIGSFLKEPGLDDEFLTATEEAYDINEDTDRRMKLYGITFRC
jgi:hypothetical protein